MRDYSGQIIHIHRIPTWAKVLHFSVLLAAGYAILIGFSRLANLWTSGVFGKFLILAGGGALIFHTYVIMRTVTIITTAAVCLRSWRGYREIQYRDVSEMYYHKGGSLYFTLKDSSKIEAWVPPSKIDEVVDVVTLAGGSVISGQ